MADESLTELSHSEISKLKVPDLKKELKLRGLSTSGNKNELVERLQGAMKASDSVAGESVADDLEEDLLNDDDDETSDIDDDDALEDSFISKPEPKVQPKPETKTAKPEKRKSDSENKETGPPKKIILNRNPSIPNEVLAEKEEKTEESKSEKKKDEKSEDTENEKKLIKFSDVTTKDRLEMRSKKFGVPLSVDAQKQARAERFGANDKSADSIKNQPVNTSLDVLKQRAQRFGGSVSTIMSKAENLEKMEKRKARFGGASSNGISSTISGDDKAKQRLERFKTPVT